jgi:hypothetical protein
MTTAAEVGHAAGDAARDTTQNRYFQLLGRLGLAAYGLVHLTIAYLAARLALGGGGAKPDKAGALQTLAAQPGGRALLWAVTVGLAMLVLWRLGEATVGLRWVQPRHKRIRKRIESALTAVVFGLLAVSGQFLVGAVGVGLLAVAAFGIYRFSAESADSGWLAGADRSMLSLAAAQLASRFRASWVGEAGSAV